MQSLRVVIMDRVIRPNTLLGGLTLDPAGMHCPSWNDAFVSSYYYYYLVVMCMFLRGSVRVCHLLCLIMFCVIFLMGHESVKVKYNLCTIQASRHIL